ncbi:glutathione S-transferase C-terminal domain-containing protein [Micromonospora endophytica]|uniref:Glutathione S-transferase n=1 Tax=Micromonospora endophytica TaxID=515350 RepID=A0A2W2DB72_9ACTN|nr:glutathione S-transferase C-terminal domain-containing protein [Micromonospora endophytica]PZG01199.1 glutathione S-transferase [Micromonospora endophytica]RIW45860.1 glutathione S-transferase [Micromonospora endophytica]BCJ61869.1 glutathione-dependent reductase [Micromonospora endophytica]
MTIDLKQRSVTADGASGLRADPERYHLYLSWSCPWAQRTAIIRSLKGLHDVVSLSYVDDERDARGWVFRERRGLDPVNGFTHLAEAYEATVPGYPGPYPVPVLWDRETHQIVSNDDASIGYDLATAFDAWGDPAVELYPQQLRTDVARLTALLETNLSGCAYTVAQTTTQPGYEAARRRVIGVLDRLDERLTDRRFLFGDSITGADVCLWPTLVRFDLLDNPLGKISERGLTGFPNLWAYARDLYQLPAFRDTTDFDSYRRDRSAIRAHGPERIVVDPVDLDWSQPHDRDRLTAA